MDPEPFSPTPGEVEAPAPLPLEPGEVVVATTAGVVLGWQPRTILIWWVPGLIFIALAWIETASLVVTLGLGCFCVALFVFYASDREVRPRNRRRQYVLTDRRLLIGGAGETLQWRPVELGDVAATQMEEGVADRVVRKLSGAATIVLELRTPGPKGEPRRTRIGPMRDPEGFRNSIDLQLGPLRTKAAG